MKKNKESLYCPYCKSNNIEVTNKIDFGLEPKSFEYYDVLATKNEKNIFLECKCNNCHNNFKYNYGKEVYLTFSEAPIVNNIGDVKLHLVFESDRTSDYKIISLIRNNEQVYLMLIEDEEYPACIAISLIRI